MYKHNERLNETPSRFGARSSHSTAKLTAARLEDNKQNGSRFDKKSERFNEVGGNSVKNSTTLSRANLATFEKNSVVGSQKLANKNPSIHLSQASKKSRITIRSDMRLGTH